MNNIKGYLSKSQDTYHITASTPDVDRDGEIILPTAFKNLPEYLKNPVILGFHDWKSFPIAKATDGRITDKSLELDIEFADTEKGREAKYLYDNQFMTSFSVGFLPKEWDTDREGRRVYTDVELVEVSAVPVPSNSMARIVREIKSKGVDLPEFEALVEKETGATPESKDGMEDEGLSKVDKIKLFAKSIK